MKKTSVTKIAAKTTNAYTAGMANSNPLFIAIGGSKQTTRMLFLSTFILIFFIFIGINNVAKASDTTHFNVDTCSDAMLQNGFCSDWTDWFDMPPHKLSFESYRHSKWPFGPKWWYCDVSVIYKVRQCNTNQYLHQYFIESIALDLGYRVWSLQSAGWVYPCREALEILKGNEEDVSFAFNQLYNEVYKALVLDGYDMVFNGFGPNYSKCDNLDPTKSNQKPLTVVSTSSSCQGTCLTYHRDRYVPIPINDREWTLQSLLPPTEYLAGKYNGGSTNGLIVEPLDSAGFAELDNYIQTEINPYIEEDWRKVPSVLLGGDGAPTVPTGFTIIATPISCAPDFCCLNRLDVCQQNDRRAHIHQTITGDVPQACLQNLPTNANCPQSPYPPHRVICNTNCGVGSYDYDDVVSPQFLTVVDSISPVIINIYPNPTNRFVEFDVPADRVLNNLELFDMEGNLLGKFSTNATSLDLSAYAIGEYYLCFTLDNTKYYRSIIISK